MKNKIIIIGVGGTGANLAAMLSRFINSQWEIILMDADRVSASNLERQAFQKHDINEFKAEALSRKINTATSTKTSFKNVFLKDHEQLNRMTKKTDELVIFGCVDNHPARMKIEKFFKQKQIFDKFERWLYVDSANELSNGEVVSLNSTEYKNALHDKLFRSDIYPKIKRSRKGDVTTRSCEERISSGDEQQYSTNLQAAIICFRIFQDWISGRETPKIVHFDWEDWRMKNA